ncbi:MAG: cell division protein FtsQ/DivIB [Acidobacteriota bacterium]
MARKQAERPETGPRRNLNHILRYATATAAMLACAIAAIAAFHKTEAFLVRDARFALHPPDQDGAENPNIRLHGIGHAQRELVEGVFDRDYGRSIYLLPLAERRRQLLAVEWVKDASIRRTWPNRLDVYLSERQPVAFLELPSNEPGAKRLALIDEEGEILEPPERAQYHLPVLAGVRKDQSRAARRDGVRRMLRLLAEAAPWAEKISEIDVGNPDNLKVTEQVDGRALTLLLGNRGFRQRLEKFHGYYPEIRSQLGDAVTLDLRVEKHIIMVKGAGNAR